MKNQFNNELQVMQDLLDVAQVPEIVNQKLNAAYNQLSEMPKAKKPAKKIWRGAMIAAALCCVLSVTALAGEQVWAMLQGTIAFFDNKPQATTIDSIMPTFEAMNAPINLSVTDQDITFKVENVSIDNNFINVFGTLNKEGLREHLKSICVDTVWDNNEIPDYWLLKFCGQIYPVAKVNNEIYGLDSALNDALNLYFIDDNTIAFAKRMLVSDELPDTFNIDLLANFGTSPSGEEQVLFGVKGDWTISAEIDLTAFKAQEKIIEPQVLAIGEKKLDLKKFSVSPLGVMAIVDEHIGEITFTDKTGKEVEGRGNTDNFTSLKSYGVRDSKGNWLRQMAAAGYGEGDVLSEFTLPAADADTITFVPLELFAGENEPEKRTAPLAVGSRLELNSISGYTIESFSIEGRHVEIVLIPYGPECNAGYGGEFDVYLADGTPAYQESARTCLINTNTDHVTGAVTFTMDFYADQPSLQNASLIKYQSFYEMTLNEANSITVPLK